MGAAERGNDPPLQSMVLARTFIVPRRCPLTNVILQL